MTMQIDPSQYTATIAARRDELTEIFKAIDEATWKRNAIIRDFCRKIYGCTEPLCYDCDHFPELVGAARKIIATPAPTLEPDQEQEPETPQRGRAANKPTRLTADGRILIKFDARPSVKTRALMREHHFAWAPTRGAWVRMDNERGRDAADKVMAALA